MRALGARVRGEGPLARVCAGQDAGLWALDASAGTLGVGTPEGAPPSATLDLRVPTGLPGEQRRKPPTPFEDLPEAEASAEEKEKRARRAETADSLRADEESENSSDPSDGGNGGSVLETRVAAVFDRVWWSYNSGAKTPLAVWRPRCPPGFASLGDVAVRALEPPASATLARVPMKESLLGEDDSEVTKKSKRAPVVLPVGFERVWRDDGWRAAGKKRGTASFWRPVPPPGYVACGHAASASHAPPPITAAWCVRSDLAVAIPRDAFVRGDGASSSPWTPAGAAFKLGRAPLAIHAEPRDPAFDPPTAEPCSRAGSSPSPTSGRAPRRRTGRRFDRTSGASRRDEPKPPRNSPPGSGSSSPRGSTAFARRRSSTPPPRLGPSRGSRSGASPRTPGSGASRSRRSRRAPRKWRTSTGASPRGNPCSNPGTSRRPRRNSERLLRRATKASKRRTRVARVGREPKGIPHVDGGVVSRRARRRSRRPHARLRRRRRRRARGGGGSRWVPRRFGFRIDPARRFGSRRRVVGRARERARAEGVDSRERGGGREGGGARRRRPPRRRRGRRTERLRGDGGFDPGVDRRDHGDSSDVPSHRGDEPRGDRGGRERKTS